VERSKQIKNGDPRYPEVVVGPLINKNQVDKSEDNINNAKEAGFDILLEGERVGNILTPTVIGNVDNDSSLARTELFSPIALIIYANSNNDVISHAHDTIFTLIS